MEAANEYDEAELDQGEQAIVTELHSAAVTCVVVSAEAAEGVQGQK